MTMRVVRYVLMVVLAWIVNQTGWPLYPFVQGILGPRYWRRFGDFIQRAWAHGVFGLMSKTKLKLYGDVPSGSHRPKVLIANHATECDWLYLWMLGLVPKNNDRTGQIKIILKEDIKHIPVFGWGCSLFGFIFLKRKWELDADNLLTRMRKFAQDDAPVWILVFPEGMTINVESQEKSHKFALQSNPPRPQFKNTLLPRSKGLEAVLSAISKAGKDPEVFDATMVFDGFSGEIPTWEMGYERNIDVQTPNVRKTFQGTCAEICHIDLRKFNGSDILAHPGGVEKWLDERFARKDKLLDHFIEKQEYPKDDCGEPSLFKVQPSSWPIASLGLLNGLQILGALAGMNIFRKKYSTLTK